MRQQKYVGNISLNLLSQFVGENLDLLEDNYLSDFFEDLSFTYSGRLIDLFNKGFATEEAKQRLFELNPGKEILINDAYRQFIFPIVSEGPTFNSLEQIVNYDDYFILEGEEVEPTGTRGSTGVKYGLRLSILLPQTSFSESELALLRQNPDFINKSKNEKAFLFDDNSFILPLATQEIDVMDAKFVYFDPLSGTERYDLECLINKMVGSSEFKLMMENIFNIKQCTSMLSIYCMESMMPSFGRKVAPDQSNDSDNYERSAGKEADPEDEWDGVINTSGKIFLEESSNPCTCLDLLMVFPPIMMMETEVHSLVYLPCLVPVILLSI